MMGAKKEGCGERNKYRKAAVKRAERSLTRQKGGGDTRSPKTKKGENEV